MSELWRDAVHLAERVISGIYTIKASAYRFPKTGGVSGMAGQEGIPPVYSPMTRTLEDLDFFWRAIFSMKPWEYDPSVSGLLLL